MKRAFILAVWAIVIGVGVAPGPVRADDVGHSCVRDQRTYTCQDGSVIDVCDPCPDGSSSDGSSYASDGRPPLPTQRVAFGVVIGPGWTVRDVETETNGSVTAGFNLNWRISRNPAFAISTNVGLQLTRMVAPSLSADASVPLLVPVSFGLAWSPGNPRLRADIGAAGGFRLALACGVPDRSCGGFYGELWAGVNSFPGNKPNGFGVDLVLLGAEAGGIAAPPILFRFSFIHRNPALR